MGTQFSDTLNMADYFLFDRLREGLGAEEAIRWGTTRFDYARVADSARRGAAVLAARGVRRGERVLLCLPDSPIYAFAIFGVLARGAVVAMGNPDAPAAQIEYLVEYTRATAVVTIPKVAQALREARQARGVGEELSLVLVAKDAATGDDVDAASGFETDALFRDFHAEVSSTPPAEKLPKLHRDEPSMWLFTSGSTGEPKANIHTHRDYAFNTEVYAKETVGYRKGDVTISVSRLYFGYATGTNLFFPFAVGGTAALFSERPSPEVMAKALTEYRPTVVTNVPTMLGKLLEYDAEEVKQGRPGLDLSSVRFSLSAGEALPEALLRRWQARFGSDVYDGIGSAEMFHIYASNRPGDIVPGSLGRAVAGYELRILPEEAEGVGATPCEPGQIGVLWVKGDSVSQCYWLDRDKSFKTFHGHWCRTGDLFHVDEKGYLYFAGRSDDLLKVGGLWVAPREIEEALMMHDAVSLAAVIGVEHEGLTKAKAFVVLRGDAAHKAATIEAELTAYLREKVSKYKVPKLYEVVADLPKNDRGKVDKKALRAGGAS